PVVTIQFDQDRVQETIQEFGKVVDDIEEGEFNPPLVQALRKTVARNQSFGRRVCQNCDGRFSCKPYREYADAPRRRYATSFLPFFDILPDEEERENWHEASIPEQGRPQDYLRDL